MQLGKKARLWKDGITGEKKEGEEEHEVLQNHYNITAVQLNTCLQVRGCTPALNITRIDLNFMKKYIFNFINGNFKGV